MVFEMSYPDLIIDIRKSFTYIYSKAVQMEKTWTCKLDLRPPETRTGNPNSPSRVVPSSIRPSKRLESCIPPEKAGPLSTRPAQGLPYTPSRYPTQTALFSRSPRNQEELGQGHANFLQQRQNSLPMFPDKASFTTHNRQRSLSETLELDDNLPRCSVPQLDFPSEALTALQVSEGLTSLENVSAHQDFTLTKPSDLAECSEVNFVPESKGMPTKSSLAFHLDLPDRFADLSWREFDDSDDARVDKQPRRAPRTTPKSQVVLASGMAASREALTTPKTDEKLHKDAVVTVMSRIFTTKPIFLEPQSVKPGKGQAK